MTKKQIRATILTIIAQIVPDEDPSDPGHDIPIREQMGQNSVGFLHVMAEQRKRYGVEVRGNDYVLPVLSERSVAFLEPRTQGL